LSERDNFHLRIQGGKRGARGFDFWRADGIRAVENLPLEVGEVDLVRIGDGQLADAARGEVERRGTTEAAGADDERMRGAQPLLALDANFIEQDVAAVAEELLVVQWAENLDSRTPIDLFGSRFPGNDIGALVTQFAFAAGLVCATEGAGPLSGSPLR
jgi:hypothetical protein